jgi:putative transposase
MGPEAGSSNGPSPGWLSRNRRMSKDYERKVQTSETLIEVAMIRLLVARLGRAW